MSYRYKQYQFQQIGISIDQIVNSSEAKAFARKEWRRIQQFKQFEEVKTEEQYKKDTAWWEFYSMETVRRFLKYGDDFPILKWMRIIAPILLPILIACSGYWFYLR